VYVCASLSNWVCILIWDLIELIGLRLLYMFHELSGAQKIGAKLVVALYLVLFNTYGSFELNIGNYTK
jgi:hypothetical protein